MINARKRQPIIVRDKMNDGSLIKQTRLYKALEMHLKTN